MGCIETDAADYLISEHGASNLFSTEPEVYDMAPISKFCLYILCNLRNPPAFFNVPKTV